MVAEDSDHKDEFHWRVNVSTAIITVSDKGSRGERDDASGRAIVDRLAASGYSIDFQSVVPDECPLISASLRKYADDDKVALIVTTGGTGVGVRDVTPEATLDVVDRTVPGMAEAMRAASLLKTPHAMISRAVVGIRGGTLIVNLPGSPKGAMENLDVLMPALPHALAKIQGDPSDCASDVGAKEGKKQ
jgi:molybdopterin adenylyltransferase